MSDSLLAASDVELRVVDPEGPDVVACLRRYFTELAERFPVGFDPSATLPLDPQALREPHGVFLVAYRRDEPLGCGGLKFHADGTAEIKRVWVSPDARGLGLGGRLLTELERLAATRNLLTVHLDSNAALTEAIAMYRRRGYREVPAFNDEPYADYWFEKTLASDDGDTLEG